MKFMILMFGLTLFLPSGDRFGKKQGAVPGREPFVVVDTLRLVGGKGKVILNNRFTTQKSNVSPTDGDYIIPFVQQWMDDTADLIHSYGIWVSDNLDTIWIKSDSADDTSKVVTGILMR